jgi:hypothetical protein
MEQAQWHELSIVIKAVCRRMRPLPRQRFSHCLITRLYFWAVLHGRPVSSAINPLHYNRLFRPRKLPSISQLNRRVARPCFQRLLQAVHERLCRSRDDDTPAAPAAALYVDGKPLPVSVVSGDRDARWGHCGKGYKLHAVVTDRLKIPMFCVLPMNRHEMPVARVMLDQMPIEPGTLVMADGNYDAHDLHKQVHAQGGWLITRPRKGGARKRHGRGHAVTRRQMGPARRALIDLWETQPAMMKRIYRERTRIERVFGHLTCTPGLLGPLPSFVRGLTRVRRWVGAKICLYHARLRAKQQSG